MHDELQELFIEYGEADYRGVRRHTTGEKSHGREERREYYVAAAQESLARD